jgi:hypothetical protein
MGGVPDRLGCAIVSGLIAISDRDKLGHGLISFQKATGERFDELSWPCAPHSDSIV